MTGSVKAGIRRGLPLLAILCMFFANEEMIILTPAINSLAVHFDTLGIQDILLAQTISGLVCVPVALIAGRICEKVGYRKMAVIGLLLASLGGGYPFFLGDGLTVYWPIVLSRFIVGLGMGIVAPIGAALIIRNYDDRERVRYLGWGAIVSGAAGVVYQMLAGFLCEVGWYYTFLAYFLTLVPAVVALLFLPEPRDIGQLEEERKTVGKKEKIPARAWIYILLYCIFFMCVLPLAFNMSIIVVEEGVGGSALAGIIGSAQTAGTVITGVVFGMIYRKLRNNTIGIAFVCAACGAAFVVFGHSAVMFIIGAAIVGFCYMLASTAMQSDFAKYVPASRISTLTGAVRAAFSLSAFCTSYYIAMCMNVLPDWGAKAPLLVAIVTCLVFGAGMLVVMRRNAKRPETVWDNEGEVQQ